MSPSTRVKLKALIEHGYRDAKQLSGQLRVPLCEVEELLGICGGPKWLPTRKRSAKERAAKIGGPEAARLELLEEGHGRRVVDANFPPGGTDG